MEYMEKNGTYFLIETPYTKGKCFHTVASYILLDDMKQR